MTRCRPATGRMALSGTTRMMRRQFHAQSEAARLGREPGEILARLERRARAEALSRRAFLAGVGGTAAALTPLPRAARAMTEARVVIIGAGLAGVRCADLLAQHAIAADIYEADDRIGGRTFSDSTTFDGLLTERGGAFISTEHNRVRNLARQMNLNLEIINGGALDEGEEIYRIDGAFYTEDEANADWRTAWRAFKQDLQDAPFPLTFDNFTARGQELDNISIPEWFDPASPFSHPILADFGPDSRFAKLCYATAIAEYGADPEEQSALNLLYTLAFNPRNSIVPLAGTDEFYHIEGGNEQLVQLMAASLPGTIHTGRALEALSTLSGDPLGPYVCHFSGGVTAVADKLVLTLPFNQLRQVDIVPEIFANLSPQKQQAINQLELGTNAKLHLELAQRTWGPDMPQNVAGETRILNGVSYSDPADFQLVWDDSVPQESGPVILLQYLGGTPGTQLKGNDPFGPANPSDVNQLLAAIEPVFAGTTDAFTGRAVQSHWADAPWVGGAYSTLGLGQYTSFWGATGTAELNLHFAGEHTSVDFQGFMEGAVESGERAGIEVFQSV